MATIDAGAAVVFGADDGALYAVDAATGEQRWAFTEPADAVASSPVVAGVSAGGGGSSDSSGGGTVYAGADDGTLYAVDAASGEGKWRFTTPSGPVASSPAVADGTVYVGANDGTLYAVGADTGERRWSFEEPSGWVSSSPAVADGTVYVGADDRTLYAVDAASGERRWAFDEPVGPVSSSPAVAGVPAGGGGSSDSSDGGTVYVGSDDRRLYAVDADTGERVWTSEEPDGPVYSSPAVVDGTVYVGAWEALLAVDAETGDTDWAFDLPATGVDAAPAFVDGVVYVGSLDGTLRAVDVETRTANWSFGAPAGWIVSAPTVAGVSAGGEGSSDSSGGGTVYVGADDGTLYAVDAASGEQRWAFEEPSAGIATTPAVAAPGTGASAGSRLDVTDP